MADGNDLSKIVSLIMENPHLIEEISNLAKGSKTETEQIDEAKQASEDISAQDRPASAPIFNQRVHPGGKNRSQLLGALKPYVSLERAQAIDSMLSIVEILDAMKGR